MIQSKSHRLHPKYIFLFSFKSLKSSSNGHILLEIYLCHTQREQETLATKNKTEVKLFYL